MTIVCPQFIGGELYNGYSALLMRLLGAVVTNKAQMLVA